MHETRLTLLADDIYQTVFHMLDFEPDVSFEDAGIVATAIEHAFRVRMHHLGYGKQTGHECPVCGRRNEIVNQCGCDPNNLPTALP